METDSLGHFIFIYEKFAEAENKSERTIGGVTSAVEKFDNFLGGCLDVKEVQGEDLRRYIRYLQQQLKWAGHPTIHQSHGVLVSNSIASYVRDIRSFWSWLLREQFIENNPFEEVKPPKTTAREIDILSSGNVSKLIKAIPLKDNRGYRDSSIIALLYGTGLRIGEVINLIQGNVNFDTGQIKVLGKGNKERSVFMSAKVFKALFKYQSQRRPKAVSKFFFIHRDGRPLSRFYFAHRMKTFVIKAGITTNCSPHTLRYSFAIQFLQNGGDERALQSILGHSTMEMTRHYAKIANSEVEKKMKEFSPAEQLDVNF